MSLGQEAVLQQGSTGQLVKTLQERLAGVGFSPGAIDGIFGPHTTDAVIRFQNAKGLTPDGIAGPQTWAAFAAPQIPQFIPPMPTAPLPVAQPVFTPAMMLAIGGIAVFAVFAMRAR